MLSVSLRTIGVMSPARMWMTVIAFVLAFVGVGVVLTYYAADLDEDRVAMGSANEDDPFLIGAAEEVSTTVAEPATSPQPDSPQTPPNEPEAAQRAERPTRNNAQSPRPNPAARPSTSSAMARASEDMGSRAVDGPSDPPGREPTPPDGPAGQSDEPPAAEDVPPAPLPTPQPSDTPSPDVPPDDQPEDRDLAMGMYVSQVRFVVRRYYAPRAQSCFDRATRNNPTLSGTVVVGLTIGSDGNISSSNVARNSTGNSSLGSCLANQARTWRLPVPPEAPLTLQLPFSR